MDKFNSLMTCFMLVFFTSLMGVIFLWFEKEMGGSLIDDLRNLFRTTGDSKKQIR